MRLPGMFLLFAGTLAGCGKTDSNSKGSAADAKSKAVPVSLGQAVRKDVPVRVSAIGYVEPLATVGIRAQVDGQIESVHFKEGQEIQRGELLFSLDERPFAAVRALAAANLERAEALADRARREAARIQRLFDSGQAADREHDQAVTEVNATAAEVLARKAELASAELDLNYCRIRAPMDGRAGAFLVFPGSTVKKNETDLVMINQLAPISVSFSLPETYLLRVKSALEGHRDVTISLTGRSTPETGQIVFVDNNVDRSTGTIRLKATFENEDRGLWPGAYGTVELTLEELTDAVVVPTDAVQAGQDTEFVFIAKSDGTVEYRPVKSSHTIGRETVVVKGLIGGETLVTDGQLRLTPGAAYVARKKVEIPPGPAATQPAEAVAAGGRE